MSFKEIKEKIIEGLLVISGSITTLTVFLIIFFLFKEGISLFNESTIESDFEIVINEENKISDLSILQIKDIFDSKIKTWQTLGGNTDSIHIFTLNNLEKVYKPKDLGENYELAPQKTAEYLSGKKNIIAYLPKKYVSTLKGYKVVNNEKVTLSNFVGGKEWYPTSEPAASFGALPLILGTLWVGFGAILFALPLGLSTAIYMSEIANPKVRNLLKPVVELLAGIPSVVYGFFGLVVIVPFIQKTLNLDVGETGLTGSILLGIMALPTIITISEDAIRQVPRALKEASLALGATHWQTIRRVVIPHAFSGISAGLVLGIGRAIGETMAVLMVTGNAAVIPTTYLAPLRTIPATIAAELGEAPFGGIHFKALFALGCVLFIMTFAINLIFEFISRKKND